MVNCRHQRSFYRQNTKRSKELSYLSISSKIWERENSAKRVEVFLIESISYHFPFTFFGGVFWGICYVDFLEHRNVS